MPRALIAALLLTACGGHPKPIEPVHGTDDPPPRVEIATPTADPLPDIDQLYAKLMTDTYSVFLYDDGMVGWYGGAGVKAVGERHARLSGDTYERIQHAFADAKFESIEQPEPTCEGPYTAIELYAGETNSIDYYPCEPDPVLDHLIERIQTLVGVDQFIDGNPAAPGGPLPDGDHLVVDYQRTVCFGPCPIYQVLLFDDGTMLWNGESSVEQLGELRVQLPPETVQAVIDTFEQARFWDLEASSDHCTDTPHTIVTYQRGDRHRTVDDGHCQEPGPLASIEDRFEELVIGDATWIRESAAIVQLEAANCVAGTCPEYTATLWSNRHVRWNGVAHVAVTGEQTAWVPMATFEALGAALDEAELFTVDEPVQKTKRKCGQRYKLTVTYDAQRKTVEDDGCGDRPRLRKLEQAIVEELNIQIWIK